MTPAPRARARRDRRAGAGAARLRRPAADVAPWAARHPLALAAALAALVGALVYLPTLGADFVWDDHALGGAAHPLRDAADLARLLTSHAFSGAGGLMGGERVVEYYRPVWTLTIAIDQALWGTHPAGYHLISLLLHAAACAAVVGLARALLGGFAAPLLAGLLFAAHPAHVEAVAWISARNELLATLFGVIALIAGLAAQRTGRAAAWMSCLASGAVALLSKESAVVLPLLAATLALLPAGGRSDTAARAIPPGGGRARRIAWPLALGLLTALYLLVRGVLVHNHPEPSPLAWRLLTAPRLVAQSLGLMIVPVGLRLFHDIPLVRAPLAPAFWVPVLLLAGWTAVAWKSRRREPVMAAGMAWMLIALLPVCGVVALLKPALLAERTLYLPSVGAVIAVAALLARIERTPRRAAVARVVAVLLVLGFAALAMLRSRAWQDDIVLMRGVVHDAPAAATGHANLAVALLQRGRDGEALPEAERAAALLPSDPLPRANLGLVYGKLGRMADAEREFRAARALDPRDFDARYGLGWLYVKQERWDDARSELEAATRLRPGHAASRVALATALLNLGRVAAAIDEYRAALVLDAGLPEARFGLGLSLAQAGRAPEAVAELSRANALRPGWAEAHFDLGVTLAQLGRIPEARAELDSAARLAADPAMRSQAEAALQRLATPRDSPTGRR